MIEPGCRTDARRERLEVALEVSWVFSQISLIINSRGPRVVGVLLTCLPSTISVGVCPCVLMPVSPAWGSAGVLSSL
ncbi:hypothetical protein AALO_G00002010 [Alosa alosa]|uniref:Uncharacterized protein n=1 Tax=Alosa alosa TaxID=278164 RepID=A0AAV6HHF2_9TELE|nr:hypothetical protein AALO_G00002010 [Alosa alosa]